MRRIFAFAGLTFLFAPAVWMMHGDNVSEESSLKLEKTEIRFEVFRIASLEIAEEDKELERAELLAKLLEGQGWEVNSVTDYNGFRGAEARSWDSRVGRRIGSQAKECVMHVVYPEAENSNTIVVTCPPGA